MAVINTNALWAKYVVLALLASVLLISIVVISLVSERIGNDQSIAYSTRVFYMICLIVTWAFAALAFYNRVSRLNYLTGIYPTTHQSQSVMQFVCGA